MKKILSLIFLLLIIACDSNSKINKLDADAEILLHNAKSFWLQGKKIKAIKEWRKVMDKYPTTKSKTTAEQLLSDHGYSPGRPLYSFTIKQMIDFENKIISYKKYWGKYPTPGSITSHIDPWGSRLFHKLFLEKKEYDFLIYSKGPDREIDTNDDLVIIHTRIDELEFKTTNITAITADDLMIVSGKYKANNRLSGETANAQELYKIKENENNKNDNDQEKGVEMSLHDFQNKLKGIGGNMEGM